MIEQEFAAAGIKRPSYGITGWVILTLIQHATADQVARWVPGAQPGGDLVPAVQRARRRIRRGRHQDQGDPADGGWTINGQKVWTSGAHLSRYGLATVRTNPDAPKHKGITTMVIDMQAPTASRSGR